ncbi:MAG TPA: hypothetical protein VKE22_20330 [Haliangiales bacterium]|nr:hypothetical protein [Haliangiales bacterium]
MRTPWWALLVLVFVLVFGAGACAGQAPSVYENRDIKKNEILMLDGKIIDYRKAMGLDPRPAPWLIQQMHRQPAAAGPLVRQSGDPCPDVCDLAVYICRAAEDICRIADELGDDDWARGKCDAAKASCSEARKRCQECKPGEKR